MRYNAGRMRGLENETIPFFLPKKLKIKDLRMYKVANCWQFLAIRLFLFIPPTFPALPAISALLQKADPPQRYLQKAELQAIQQPLRIE